MEVVLCRGGSISATVSKARISVLGVISVSSSEDLRRDLRRQSTAYFIFDTKESETYGDKDFVRYEWSPSF